MIRFRNYFKENSKSVKKFSLALKGFIGSISVSAYANNDVKLAFWLLMAGAALDFFIQFLPEDTEIPGKNGVITLLVLASFLCLSGCKVIKPGTDTLKTDETNISYKEQDVKVAGASVNTSLNTDSLIKAALRIKAKFKFDSTQAVLAGKPIPPAPKQKQTFTDPQSKAQLTYWLDQYGKLQITCESKDQVVKMLVAEVTRLTKEVTKKIEIIEKTPVWNWIAISVLGTLFLISVLLNVLTLKRR